MANSILIVENDSRDVLIAADVARSVGLVQLRTFENATKAMRFLETAMEGKVSLPDAILVDLDLGYESGYDVLRLWHLSPRLSAIPLFVWSVLGGRHESMCELFKVTAFVPKWKGKDGLRDALQGWLANEAAVADTTV